MTIPRCLCCDKPLSPVACFDGWCYACVGSVLDELLALADLRPGEVAIMADMLRQVGARTMAQVVARVPFSEPQPSARTLERLTDE